MHYYAALCERISWYAKNADKDKEEDKEKDKDKYKDKDEDKEEDKESALTFPADFVSLPLPTGYEDPFYFDPLR